MKRSTLYWGRAGIADLVLLLRIILLLTGNRRLHRGAHAWFEGFYS